MSAATVWETGAGRIVRRGMQLWIGDTPLDVDTLRSDFPVTRLQASLEKLDPPITAAEAVWVSHFVHRMTRHNSDAHYTSQMDALLAIIQNPDKVKHPMTARDSLRKALTKMDVPLAEMEDDATIDELRLDSLDMMEIIFDLEADLGISIGDGEITQDSSIHGIITLCEKKTKTP